MVERPPSFNDFGSNLIGVLLLSISFTSISLDDTHEEELDVDELLLRDEDKQARVVGLFMIGLLLLLIC